jgi:hypothetical protein
MYDAFFVPPLSAANYTSVRTYGFKKCRAERLGAVYHISSPMGSWINAGATLKEVMTDEYRVTWM